MVNEFDDDIKRLLLNVTSFILIFIFYASLLPYNIEISPIDASLNGFLSALKYSIISAEPGKWIGHFIFNALVAFVGSLYCGLCGQRRKWLLVFGGLFLFGVLIEYFQLFIGGRGTSLVDIYANIAGLVVGFLLWGMLGKFTISALRYYYEFETLPLNFVRKLYLAFVIVIILFPFDFYFTPLQFEMAFATKGMPLFELDTGEGIGSISLLAASVLTFPIGVLYRLSSSSGKRRTSRTINIFVKFVVLFLFLEILQFFEVSGQSSLASLCAKYAGFTIGFIVGRFFELKFLLEMALKFRLLIYVGLIIFIGLALKLKGLTFLFPLSVSASMDIIAATSFLPFRYYIDVGSGEALLSFLLNFVIFIPIGAVMAIRQIASGNFKIRSFSGIFGVGLVIALIFEILVLLWGLKRPDVTNILVSAFAMPVGYYFVVMCLNSISRPSYQQNNQLS